MGHRLSKIYTKTGDAGETGLGDGTRVAKDDPRVVALGEVDELNSVIGLLLTEPLPPDVVELLHGVQHDLFDLGGELSIPGYTGITAAQVQRIEATLDAWNETLPPLKEFILPGGSRAAAYAHLARTVCRRSERAIVTLGRMQRMSDVSRIYLNRLSDALFQLARILNKFAGRADVFWQKGKNAASAP